MNNTINEYLDYIKSNNLQDDLSDYFTTYVSSNNPELYEQFTTPNINSELKVSELTKINNPIVQSNSFNVKSIISPPVVSNNTSNPTINTSNTSTTPNLKGDKNKTAKYIRDYFINKGLSKEQASGITGNLFTESRFNTSAIGDTHLKTSSEGIAQWRENRLNNLKTFAKSKNSDYKNLNIQLDFLWNELNTSEKSALNSLRNSKSIEESARNFANKFERMKTYSKDRENYAKYFYNL